jgi:5'-nucleotidase
LTIDSPLDRFDCGPTLRAERGCHERRVILVHSGAFGRYVGRIELSLAPAASPDAGGTPDGLEVVSATHSLLPVSSQVEEEPAVAELLEPYRKRLASEGFDTPVAFALGPVPRYGDNGGDSALGNLIADAIRARAEADIALLNTTGIRADLPPGQLTKAQLVAALPFGDTLTVLRLSGAQLSALFEKQAQLAGSRACESPFQGSGFTVSISCRAGAASHLEQLLVGGAPVSPSGAYFLVTTDYLADSGAGFDAAAHLSKRMDLGLDPLDVLLEAVSHRPACGKPALPCLDPSTLPDGRIRIDPG